MKILMMAESFPDFGCKSVERLARGLFQLGYQVEILSTKARLASGAVDLPEEVLIHRIGGLFIKKFEYVILPSAPLHILRWAARDEIDLIHAHFFAYNFTIFASLLKKLRLLRKPLIITMHGIATSHWHPLINAGLKVYDKLLPFILSSVDHVTCVSKEAQNFLIEGGYPETNVSYIPNGVDASKFTPASTQEKATLREKLGLPKGATIILFSGRININNGIIEVIEAFTELQERKQDIALVIVGSGAHENLVESAMSTLPIGKCFFPGFADNIEDYYRAADIYVLPALNKVGLPLTLLEAAACQLPVIATPLDGITEIIDGSSMGLFVRPGSVNELIEALTQLLDDSDLRQRLGANVHTLVNKSYTIRANVERHTQLYEDYHKSFIRGDA